MYILLFFLYFQIYPVQEQIRILLFKALFYFFNDESTLHGMHINP